MSKPLTKEEIAARLKARQVAREPVRRLAWVSKQDSLPEDYNDRQRVLDPELDRINRYRERLDNSIPPEYIRDRALVKYDAGSLRRLVRPATWRNSSKKNGLLEDWAVDEIQLADNIAGDTTEQIIGSVCDEGRRAALAAAEDSKHLPAYHPIRKEFMGEIPGWARANTWPVLKRICLCDGMTSALDYLHDHHRPWTFNPSTILMTLAAGHPFEFVSMLRDYREERLQLASRLDAAGLCDHGIRNPPE